MNEHKPVSDNEIIDRILNGDTNAYSILMRKYNQRMYRICKGFLKDEADIEDLMQNAYVKAYTNLRRFEGKSSFSTWLIRILINESLQKLNRTAKEQTLLENDLPDILHVSDQSNPEKISMNRELREIIEKNIENLPENYRVVFLMREVEKINIAETAEILNISEANVKVRLNRAKEFLRRSLLQAYAPEELYSFNLIRCDKVVQNVMNAIAPRPLLENMLPN